MAIGTALALSLGALGSALIGTGMQHASNSVSRSFNKSEAQLTREFSALEAQKNRDWQEKMSNTAYSRAVADAKSVGINPYQLSLSGASTPSGSVLGSSSASSSPSGESISSLSKLLLTAFSLGKSSSPNTIVNYY